MINEKPRIRVKKSKGRSLVDSINILREQEVY